MNNVIQMFIKLNEGFETMKELYSDFVHGDVQ